MNNILLVVPRYRVYGKHYVMPLGILYVSSFLKEAGVEVYTLNLNHHKGDERDILRDYVCRYKIQSIGVGGLSGEYTDLHRITIWVREDFPSVKIIVGGGIMTADPKNTMKAFPEADYGIVGEGEYILLELLQNLQCSNKQHINGIIYRNGNKLIQTARRQEIADLDSLPIPDYEGFNYDEYLSENPDLSDEGKKYSQVSVIGGRSCKYNCTFCFHPSGTTYRQRSLDSIFHEIDYLVSHYSISYIALREELFATDNERVREFCNRVQQYNFDWSVQLRIDNINDELIEMLRGTRCRYIFVGVESACNEILKSMHKKITIEQIEEALYKLKRAGLNFRTGLILGDSEDNWDTVHRSIDWFYAHHDYRMYVDMIVAFPGSRLYQRAITDGKIDNPVRFLQQNCPIVNVSKLTDEEYLQLVHEVEQINHRTYNVYSADNQ